VRFPRLRPLAAVAVRQDPSTTVCLVAGISYQTLHATHSTEPKAVAEAFASKDWVTQPS